MQVTLRGDSERYVSIQQLAQFYSALDPGFCKTPFRRFRKNQDALPHHRPGSRGWRDIGSRLMRHRWLMSALLPKADIEQHDWHVRFVPKADIRIAADLFDHLVGGD
jgi:hypothetical protein